MMVVVGRYADDNGRDSGWQALARAMQERAYRGKLKMKANSARQKPGSTYSGAVLMTVGGRELFFRVFFFLFYPNASRFLNVYVSDVKFNVPVCRR